MRAYLREVEQYCVVTLRSVTQLEKQIEQEHLENVIEEESQKLKFDVMEEEASMNEFTVGMAKDEKLSSKSQSLGEVEIGIELPIQKKQ